MKFRLPEVTLLIFSVLIFASGCQNDLTIDGQDETLPGDPVRVFSCNKANPQQVSLVNSGLGKVERFLAGCRQSTGNSGWCDQLVRPNPDSRPTFVCTYSSAQPHFLIDPDESTWGFAFTAVQIIQEMERAGIKVCAIYNWWRPEPYNGNVGGAAGRHPYGTSVDVRFCSMSDVDQGFSMLCKFRKAGRLRAIGYYGSTALHFGIGDRVANTWGKSCP